MTEETTLQPVKRKREVRYSLLMKLLLVFVFFLPLRGVQVPIGIFGFEINPARIASVFFTIIILLNICLDINYFNELFHTGRYRNPFVFWLFIYFLFSILYYYFLVMFGKTVLFGTGEGSFLRNWQGRPLAQLISFVTYGLIPFYLIKRYAQDERTRKSIERVFVRVILLLIGFACVQVVTYIFLRVPIIGRQILEHKYDLGAVSIFGIPFYRVNSLAGEPRDFGTFLIGAIPFYAYVRYCEFRLFTKINLILMVCVLALTTSNSAFVTLGFFALTVCADAIYRKRVHIRLKHVKYGLIGGLLIFLIFRTQLIEIIGNRTIVMYEAITVQLKTGSVQPVVQEQTSNVVILYYILNLPNMSPVAILFGSGYSNFITPVVALYQQYFNRTLENTGIFTSDVAAARLFVEGGVVGLALFSMMFFYTLKINTRLLDFFREQRDKTGYNKTLLLRFAFIGFFIAGATQNSYYYFIPMGIITGWLNSVKIGEKKSKKLLYKGLDEVVT